MLVEHQPQRPFELPRSGIRGLMFNGRRRLRGPWAMPLRGSSIVH